jgi:hypothetical protein
MEVAGSLREAARWDEFLGPRLAEGYALLGQKDEAFYWLEHARNIGSSYYQLLSVIWFLSSLHDAVRFQELMKRMKQQYECFEV